MGQRERDANYHIKEDCDSSKTTPPALLSLQPFVPQRNPTKTVNSSDTKTIQTLLKSTPSLHLKFPLLALPLAFYLSFRNPISSLWVYSSASTQVFCPGLTW